MARAGEGSVDIGVTVDVGPEGGAAGLADGVGAGEGGEVTGGEAIGGKHGGEGGEGGGGGGNLRVGSGLAGGRGVSAAELDCPCSTT